MVEYKQFNFLDDQIEILLRALELYSFNLHHTWTVNINSEDEDLRNSLVFHTYHQLLVKQKHYSIGYNVLQFESLRAKREEVKKKKRKFA